jgi:hypothetical protein
MSHATHEQRYLCSELVSVLYEDASRHTHQAVANLEEISASTATLLSEEKLDLGRPISFSIKDHDLYGVVESSVFDPILGWFSKIKLDRLSRWHGRLFVPEHLFALCASAMSDVTTEVTTRVR